MCILQICRYTYTWNHLRLFSGDIFLHESWTQGSALAWRRSLTTSKCPWRQAQCKASSWRNGILDFFGGEFTTARQRLGPGRLVFFDWTHGTQGVTWNPPKMMGFQQESLIPGCHVQVNHIKLCEGTKFHQNTNLDQFGRPFALSDETHVQLEMLDGWSAGKKMTQKYVPSGYTKATLNDMASL